MKRKWCLILLGSLFVCFVSNAQIAQFAEYPYKKLNIGLKAGFNTSFLNTNNISYNGTLITDIDVTNKIGYQIDAFLRINFNRTFLQTGLTWHYSQGSISFLPIENIGEDKPVSSTNVVDYNFTNKAVDLPVLFGYHLVQEGPYCLSLILGPKVRYAYSNDYDFNNMRSLVLSQDSPIQLSATCGVSFTIWRLFFDAFYDYGILANTVLLGHNTLDTETNSTLKVSKRINSMSFTIGMLF